MTRCSPLQYNYTSEDFPPKARILASLVPAIKSFVEGNDVLVILPSGYGKSLCFALLPLVFDYLRGEANTSIVICVSPLTSLIMEQRRRFSHRGLSAEFVGELQTDPKSMRNVEEGNVQLLYA